MIDEPLTDAQRRLLIALVMGAMPKDRGDPELTAIIAKLSGTDTVVIARRAYPSHGLDEEYRELKGRVTTVLEDESG